MTFVSFDEHQRLERQTRGMLAIVAGIAFAVAAFIAGYQYLHSTTSGSSCDCGPMYFTVEELVQASDLIAVVEFVGDHKERVEVRHPQTGEPQGTRTTTWRSYRVVEPLKDDTLSDTPGEVVLGAGPSDRNKTYVVFLERRLAGDPPYYLQPGTPFFAELRGDELLFEATDDYREVIEALGLERPVNDSDAPFALTLTQLRELAGP